MLTAASTVVWACAVYLATLGLAALFRPRLAERFLQGHAASPMLNTVEAGARAIAGVGFIVASPGMRLSLVFFSLGCVLVISAVVMLMAYGFHRRFAAWSVPFAVRILPLLGLFSLAGAGVIAWAAAKGS